MNTREFFELLLPDTGWIFTATIVPSGKGGYFINTAHTSLDHAVQDINVLTFQQKAAYFALASYKDEKVWDPSWVDRTGEKKGRFRSRTQANAIFLKCFFLDLDVDPTDPQHKFASKAEALADFEIFRAKVGLPEPMVVDSGGGYHLYWPLHKNVPVDEWRATAEAFKLICINEGFKADRSLTSDQARVLRALGGYNVRRDHPVELVRTTTPIAYDTFKGIIDGHMSATGAALPRPKLHVPSAGHVNGDAATADLWGAGNLGTTNDPVNLDKVAFLCEQMGAQVGTRGATTGEKLWRAALGIAKFAEPADLAYRAVSDAHPEYDEQRTIIKLSNWRTGPTTCESFHTENPLVCEGCRFYKKITSPIELGRHVEDTPRPSVVITDPTTGIPAVVKIIELPKPYVRRKDGAIVIRTEDDDGKSDDVLVSPIDFYPVSILRQSGTDGHIDEKSLWRAHLPKLGAQDFEVPVSMTGDGRKLATFLPSKGMVLLPDQAKAIQSYMSAYLQKLSAEADREKLYEHMGWNDSRTAFALADTVLHRDGTSTKTQPCKAVRTVTREGMKAMGTLDGWRSAMHFYRGAGYEGHRMFLYAAFGSPLFHMNDTGNKGVIMSASGASGRGKTTCLLACASVWGEPHSLVLNANKDGSTMNAMYEALGAYHNLPFLWDDATERESDDMKRLLLNVSQGEGKIRMKDGQGLSERRLSWELMMLMTSNIDERARTMASGKEVDPHLMRLVGVEFSLVATDHEAKRVADDFTRAIKQNYGHAGPLFMKAVVANYDAVRTRYINNVAKVDRLVNSANASAERFWSAAVAACYTGASLAKHLGILPAEFDIETDLNWMVSHLRKQRELIDESRQSSLEIVSEFLEEHISNTLTVSTKQAGNLDNIVHKPFGALLVRANLDSGRIHLSRAAMMEYCRDNKASFKTIEDDLFKQGILKHKNCLKVLGADTPYAKGQTRCWLLDSTKLAPPTAATIATSTTPTNVVPIGVRSA
jgi:hypothetical protein